MWSDIQGLPCKIRIIIPSQGISEEYEGLYQRYRNIKQLWELFERKAGKHTCIGVNREGLCIA